MMSILAAITGTSAQASSGKNDYFDSSRVLINSDDRDESNFQSELCGLVDRQTGTGASCFALVRKSLGRVWGLAE